jgi:hypothetical protein
MGQRAMPDLELPCEPRTHPLPPEIPLAELVRRCGELRLWFPDAMPTEEERLRSKVAAEFIL